MNNPKSFEVWLAVKLTVEVVASEEGQSPWSGDAVIRGADWLTKVVRDASLEALDIVLSAGAVDLTDAAVRFLNQSGVDPSDQTLIMIQ